MEAKEITFKELKKISKSTEGFVLMGCGGSIEEWVNGITEMLHEEKALKSKEADKVWEKALKVLTTGGRTDLILTFPKKPSNIKLGRLAIVRLAIHEDFSNSWLSDYIPNYRNQHS